MERLQKIWRATLFECAYFKITTREIGVIIVLLILLLFALVRCEDTERTKKIEALEDTCTFSKRNLHTLEDLLERSDICSERWFEDYRDYMHRIEEQNGLLETRTSKGSKGIYPLQVELLKALETFYEKQDETNLKELQEKVEKYQKYYGGLCKGEIGA